MDILQRHEAGKFLILQPIYFLILAASLLKLLHKGLVPVKAGTGEVGGVEGQRVTGPLGSLGVRRNLLVDPLNLRSQLRC